MIFLKKKKENVKFTTSSQQPHNNHTTTLHMRVGSTHWGPPSCEGLLCGCCDSVVYESNLKKKRYVSF
jgi:hypothetical protein